MAWVNSIFCLFAIIATSMFKSAIDIKVAEINSITVRICCIEFLAGVSVLGLKFSSLKSWYITRVNTYLGAPSHEEYFGASAISKLSKSS